MGLIMPKDLDTLNREELGRLFPIILSEHRAEWKELFSEEKKGLIRLLTKEMVIRIEHIGSTAVPGLLAKPTIDILLEIRDYIIHQNEIKEIMSSSGYIHMKEQINHMMFVKGYTPEGFKGQCYHIHMEPEGAEGIWDRLYFRDYLISNPKVAEEYGALKKVLAKRYEFDRDGYTDTKTDFIKKVTMEAKMVIKIKHI
ncbi:MAG: GrpB family protein [Deltaproteobacteria bacterium]|nr:GrpB family protein [Deltaproteobacteria bacterium]